MGGLIEGLDELAGHDVRAAKRVASRQRRPKAKRRNLFSSLLYSDRLAGLLGRVRSRLKGRRSTAAACSAKIL